MLMNTVLGKSLAIWLMAGRPLAALFLFGAVEAWYWWRKLRRRNRLTQLEAMQIEPHMNSRLTQ